MNIRIIKNTVALIAYLMTVNCIATTPFMVKWYLSMYIIFLVALWLGHDPEDHE